MISFSFEQANVLCAQYGTTVGGGGINQGRRFAELITF